VFLHYYAQARVHARVCEMKPFDSIIAGYAQMTPYKRLGALTDSVFHHFRATNSSARQILLALALVKICAERGGYCDETSESLAKRCQITDSAAGKALGSLAKRGVIAIDRRSDGAIWRTIRPIQH